MFQGATANVQWILNLVEETEKSGFYHYVTIVHTGNKRAEQIRTLACLSYNDASRKTIHCLSLSHNGWQRWGQLCVYTHCNMLE